VTGDRVELVVPDSVVEAIATRAAEIVLEHLAEQPTETRWLTGAKAAADYLGCSHRRVYSRLHEIPHVKDEGRLVFSTADLDAWLRSRTVP
jgi:hypothetical protein